MFPRNQNVWVIDIKNHGNEQKTPQEEDPLIPKDAKEIGRENDQDLLDSEDQSDSEDTIINPTRKTCLAHLASDSMEILQRHERSSIARFFARANRRDHDPREDSSILKLISLGIFVYLAGAGSLFLSRSIDESDSRKSRVDTLIGTGFIGTAILFAAYLFYKYRTICNPPYADALNDESRRIIEDEAESLGIQIDPKDRMNDIKNKFKKMDDYIQNEEPLLGQAYVAALDQFGLHRQMPQRRIILEYALHDKTIVDAHCKPLIR